MKVYKVGDFGCPVCEEMSQFDHLLAFQMGWTLVHIAFDNLRDHPALSDYIKTNLVAPDGTVDIPMYIVESDGDLVGAVVGRHTKSEFKRLLLQVAG